MIGKMKKKKWMAILIVLAISMIFISCAHAKPPKPGPDFIWIEAHTTPAGEAIPGHWKYAGPAVKGKTWVPGHYMGAWPL